MTTEKQTATILPPDKPQFCSEKIASMMDADPDFALLIYNAWEIYSERKLKSMIHGTKNNTSQ